MKTIRCNECGYEISSESIVCPHCEKNVNKIKIENTVNDIIRKIKAVFFLVLFFAIFVFNVITVSNFQLGLLFTLGVILQGYFLIQHNFNKETIGKFLLCVVGSILLTTLMIAQLKGNDFQTAFFILSLFCIIFSLLFFILFRKRILYKIDEPTLIIWNTIFLYLYFSKFGIFNILTPIFIILSAINFVIIFLPNAPKFFWKVFLHGWFLFMMIFLAFYHFNLKIFSAFLGISSLATYNPVDAILTGMIFLYIVAYSMFILTFMVLPIPITMNRKEKFSFQKRKEEIKNHALLLSNTYDNRQYSFLILMLVLVFTGGGFIANYYFKFISDYALINIFLIISFCFFNFRQILKPPIEDYPEYVK